MIGFRIIIYRKDCTVSIKTLQLPERFIGKDFFCSKSGFIIGYSCSSYCCGSGVLLSHSLFQSYPIRFLNDFRTEEYINKFKNALKELAQSYDGN